MFKNMNMGEKVMGSLLLLASIVAIAGLLGIYGMSRISKSLDEVVSVNLPGVTALEIIHEAQTSIQRDERTLLLRGTLTNEEKARLFGSMEGAWKRVDSAWNIYEHLSKSKESEDAWNKFKPAWATWKNDQQKVFNLVKVDRRTDATALSLGVALKSFNRVEELLGEVIAVTKKDTKAQTAGVITASSILKWVMICAIVLSILLYVSIVISINRDMTHFLAGLRDEVRKIVNAVCGGNLTARGDPGRVNYELRDIVRSFNEALDAVTGPLKVFAVSLGKIAQSEIPPIIRFDYNGDFNLIKNNLNACIEIIQRANKTQNSLGVLFADISLVARSALDGNFAARADAAKHQGAFRNVISNINEILDSVTEPVKIASEYKDRIASGEISPSVFGNSQSDVKDIFFEMVAQHNPYSGNFIPRADDATHHGNAHIKVVSDINKTTDTVTDPVDAVFGGKERRGEISWNTYDNYNGNVNDIFFAMLARNKPCY